MPWPRRRLRGGESEALRRMQTVIRVIGSQERCWEVKTRAGNYHGIWCIMQGEHAEQHRYYAVWKSMVLSPVGRGDLSMATRVYTQLGFDAVDLGGVGPQWLSYCLHPEM